MHPGGLKQELLLKCVQNILKKCLSLLLKACFQRILLGRQMFKKLHVYAGSEHPHQAQQPEVYELRG